MKPQPAKERFIFNTVRSSTLGITVGWLYLRLTKFLSQYLELDSAAWLGMLVEGWLGDSGDKVTWKSKYYEGLVNTCNWVIHAGSFFDHKIFIHTEMKIIAVRKSNPNIGICGINKDYTWICPVILSGFSLQIQHMDMCNNSKHWWIKDFYIVLFKHIYICIKDIWVKFSEIIYYVNTYIVCTIEENIYFLCNINTLTDL